MIEHCFKVKIIFPVTNKISEDEVDEEEISETDRITMKNDGLEYGYEFGWGYWDLLKDSILQINPRCVLKKGASNKKYYSEVVFESNSIAYSAHKPEELFELLIKFKEENPDSVKD